MNIIEKIKKFSGRGGAKNLYHGRDDEVLCRDRDGREMCAPDVVAELREALATRRSERLPLELQWLLNSDFLSGHQTCSVNSSSGRIEEDEIAREYMERGVYNRIAPLIETRIANLKTVSYTMAVEPLSGEADDVEKSLVSTKLLRYALERGGFDEVKNSLLQWSELCGSAFVLSFWDREKSQSRGGELSYELLTPFEVFPESLCKENIEDQRDIIIEQIMHIDDIFDRWGVEVEGADTDGYQLGGVAGGSSYNSFGNALSYSSKKIPMSASVVTRFERAGGRHPMGRLTVIAGDRLLWYGELPFDEIPITQVKCREVAGQFFGRSIIADLIPLQRAYNGVKNKIHDYVRAVSANPILIPEGAIDDIEGFADRGLPPGEIVEYNSDRGKPEPLPPAPLPAELRHECAQLVNDMEYTAGVSQLMVMGETPSGVTSGNAIESLRRIDNTRLAVSAENLRLAVRRIAGIWLRLYKRYSSGFDTYFIVGEGLSGGTLTWCADDINSFNVRFESENELISSPESQKSAFLEALRLGLLHDENGRLPRDVKRRALALMKVGAIGADPSLDELQVQTAARENALLGEGVAPTVGIYDDHAIHAEEHVRYAMQLRFDAIRRREPKLAAEFDRHIAEHILRAKAFDTSEVTPE